jgi:hypothetical protein
VRSTLFFFRWFLNLLRMQMDHTEDDYDEEGDSSFVLYSLRNHRVVKRLALSGPPSTFAANDKFIVVVSDSSFCKKNQFTKKTFLCRAWFHHLLYSFFHLQDSRLCILYHRSHLNRSRLYLIAHPLLSLLLLLLLLLPPE